jgi:hypothetical protein
MRQPGYFPSRKIKGKHKLDSYIRDVYAGFSPRLHIRQEETLENIKDRSLVDVSYEKKMGIRDGNKRYYYYVARTSRKPSKLLVAPHPVTMQRKGWFL